MLAAMKRLAALLLVCAACGGDDIELYPVSPGGGGPSSGAGFGADANEGDGDGGVQITGRVCVITDARTPTTNCKDTGADGLTVTLGTSTAMTMANGDFTIRVISGANNVWRVSGTTIAPSAMTFTSSNTIPALTAQAFSDMAAANNAAVASSGSIIAQLRSNNAPLVNATATTSPAPSVIVRYDGADSVNWDQNGTGALGVVWVPGITPTATASLTVTNAAQVSTTFMNIPVFTDTVTWLTANVP